MEIFFWGLDFVRGYKVIESQSHKGTKAQGDRVTEMKEEE